MTKRQLRKLELHRKLIKKAEKVEEDIMQSYIGETRGQRTHIYSHK